jgi:APA family basic amino acid/polyamine antiporter
MKPRPFATPVRGLGALDATALVVGSIVGSGIFFTSGEVANQVATPAGFLGVWLAGGLIALAGALCNAELATLFPRGGGDYVYLGETYGPWSGFLSGWTSFWVGFPGSIATMAAAWGAAVASLAGVHAPWAAPLFGTLAVATLTAVNSLGLGPGKWTQNVFVAAKVGVFLVLLVVGALWGQGDLGHFRDFLAGDEEASGLALALIPVSFAYLGWNAATYVAGEIREPQRNLSRALVGGTLFSVFLYLAVNALYLFAVPIGEIRGVTNVAELAGSRLFDTATATALQALVALVILSSLQATVITGPRIYQAMAADGLFFAPLSRLHPRFRVPVVALGVQGALACALLWSGTFGRLLTYTVVPMLLFSTLTVAAVFVLRLRAPALPRPFRTPGYPLTPFVFMAANLWVLGNVVASGAFAALAGLGIVAAGLPVYLWFRGSARRGRLAPRPN